MRSSLPLLLPACLLCACATLPITGADRDRPRIEVRLEPVKAGGKAVRLRGTPTNVLPMPSAGGSSVLVATEKRGVVKWFDLDSGDGGVLLDISPLGDYPEMGLVGIAFHPRFSEGDRRIFTYHLDRKKDGEGPWSVISSWTLQGEEPAQWAMTGRVELMRVAQPQEGHNAGCIAFGPDGHLYIGFGDGGFQRDPNDVAQARDNFFSAILRIDVDRPGDGTPYAIPADNPFLHGGHRPEVFAWGFRNPWRFAFDPHGRLIVADVGQDRTEEIDVAVAGGNYGWSVKEGSDCFQPERVRPEGHPACDDPSLIDPVYEYGRSEGSAVIGGPVVAGGAVPGLAGKFVFGDNVSGRLWALELPPPGTAAPATVHALGQTFRWITTIGQDPAGEPIVATWNGDLYRIRPAR